MADVFLGSVYATLELRNVDQFQRQLGNASQSGTTFKNTMLGVFAGNLLTQGFQQVTQAVVGFAKEAVTGAADLQSSMGLLQAVTGATQAQMDKFSQTAIQLGNDITLPNVAASDAADAMIELGKAGLSVNDVLGASKGVLQAATAGNISVADSAQIVSGALLTFGLKGEEASRVADLLAASANASSLELGDVGFALTQAGAQASIAGLSLEQTVGIIAQMANKGISARQAGTSLSYMLKSLTAPTEKAAGVMEDLGLKMFDSEGKFIGVRAAIAQLSDKTKGLTQEQRAQALSTMFGAEALKSANVLINDGVAGYDKMQVAVTKQGAAQDLAKARMVGFNGAMASLQNTIETAALQIGQVFLPVLTNIATFIGTNFVPILAGFGGALVGLGIYAVVASGGFFTLAAAVWAAMAPILPFVAIGVALAAGLAILQEKFDIFGKAANGVKTVFKFLSDAIQPLLPIFRAVADFVGSQFTSIFNSLKSIFDQIVKAVQPLVSTMVEFYQKHAAAFQTAFKVIGIAVAAITFGPLAIAIGIIVGVITVLAKILEFVAKHFMTIAKVVGVVIAIAFLPLTIAIAAIVGAVMLVIKVVQHWGDIMNFIGGVVGSVIGFIGGLFAAIGGAIMAVVNAIGSVVSTVFNAISVVITTVFNAIMMVWTTVLKPVFDAIAFVITALFTIVFTIFTGIATVIFTVVSTIVQIIGIVLYGIVLFIYNNILLPIWNFFVTIWNAIYTVVSTVVQTVVDFLVSAFTIARDFVVGVFQAISDFIVGIWNAIYEFLAPIVQSIVDFLVQRWQNLKTNTINAFNAVWSFISSVWGKIYDTVSGFIGKIVSGVASGFNLVKDKVSDAIRNAYNAAVGFAKDFLSAGKDIIDGIVRGVSNGKDAVVNKIKDICSGALDAVKSFFGISSPSKVMQKMFGFVMDGAKLGITKNSGGLMDAFNDATQLLPSAMSIPVTAVGSYSGSVAGQAGGGSGMSGSVNNSGGNVSIGEVTINSRQDDSRFLQLIGRNTELAQTGMIGAGS